MCEYDIVSYKKSNWVQNTDFIDPLVENIASAYHEERNYNDDFCFDRLSIMIQWVVCTYAGFRLAHKSYNF